MTALRGGFLLAYIFIFFIFVLNFILSNNFKLVFEGLIMKKIIYGFVFAGLIYSQNLFAVDVEDGVKDFKKTDDWVSFAIADNYFNKTLATRAATEDTRTNATLAFNYPTNNNCKITPVELILKLREPLAKSESFSIFGNLQFDSLPPERIEATVHNEQNSEFTFITIDYAAIDKKVRNAKNLMFNFKGYGVINFSLKGAKAAIDEAKGTCQNFAF